jgi:hypothetical protein
MTSNSPDFFCIGAQKGGTRWLYDQLRTHPDFWMPPVKELHYFDRDRLGFVWSGPAENRAARHMQSVRRKVAKKRRRSKDERDLHFLEKFENLYARPEIDLQDYCALFASKSPLVSGDITPGYSLLQDEVVHLIARHMPELKIVFLARDPVERAWSQISMAVRNEAMPAFDTANLREVRRHLLRPELLLRSHPSKIVARWRRHFATNRVRVYFFDDLQKNPADVRRRIIEFLGGDPGKISGELQAGHNRKAQQKKLQFTDEVRSFMASVFEHELKSCANELGGAASEWPTRYGF